VQLQFSDNEIEAIKVWADSAIHGGHWGDGDLTIPEESIILRKLEVPDDGHVDLSSEEAKIIFAWSESSRGIHTMEEESVLTKLRLAIGGSNR
jgi:hypothetical protein